LAEVERLERESAARPALSTRLMDPAELARILALAQDLPALWQAGTTTQVERKQLLGFLIKDVCLMRAETTIGVAIRWRTEACTVLNIPRPKRTCDARRTAPAAPVRLRVLAAVRGYPGCNCCLVMVYDLLVMADAIGFPLFFRGWLLGSTIANMA
jgi:hypothetical protein